MRKKITFTFLRVDVDSKINRLKVDGVFFVVVIASSSYVDCGWYCHGDGDEKISDFFFIFCLMPTRFSVPLGHIAVCYAN